MSRDHYPNAPGYKDAGAGRDAAEAFAPKIGARQSEVLRTYDGLPDATPDEVAELIGRPHHATRPRVSELYLLGELIKTDRRRRSAFGASQTVYRRATAEERAIFAARKAAEAEHEEAAA